MLRSRIVSSMTQDVMLSYAHYVCMSACLYVHMYVQHARYFIHTYLRFSSSNTTSFYNIKFGVITRRRFVKVRCPKGRAYSGLLPFSVVCVIARMSMRKVP